MASPWYDKCCNARTLAAHLSVRQHCFDRFDTIIPLTGDTGCLPHYEIIYTYMKRSAEHDFIHIYKHI